MCVCGRERARERESERVRECERERVTKTASLNSRSTSPRASSLFGITNREGPGSFPAQSCQICTGHPARQLEHRPTGEGFPWHTYTHVYTPMQMYIHLYKRVYASTDMEGGVTAAASLKSRAMPPCAWGKVERRLPGRGNPHSLVPLQRDVSSITRRAISREGKWPPSI